MVLSTLRSLARWAVIAAAFTVSASSLAASSVLVWPVYQIIESDQNGSALWLENRGADPVTLQIRVYAWKQENFNETYADQSNIVISPPFATVAPGERQLIRLIRNTPAPARTEQAYRIIIDEVPSSLNQPKESGKPMVGLQLQMRYLLPLFIDGEGLWTDERTDIKRDSDSATKPILSWSLQNVGGKPYLQVHNSGIVHARLSNVFWSASNNQKQAVKTMTTGFLGYVLPGKTMRWPLPSGAGTPSSSSQLNAQIADNTRPIVIKYGE